MVPATPELVADVTMVPDISTIPDPVRKQGKATAGSTNILQHVLQGAGERLLWRLVVRHMLCPHSGPCTLHGPPFAAFATSHVQCWE
jgi:hypothetical protein